ncbi:post-initiation translation factor DPC29 NDAI_0D03870 [Naumovozyma dairenensis CBS 421]|uniref:Transcriptional regulatory protein n=1 Tax=Naumovozyma dairenensis (strain ATCC 10597 / BCRC 20456 / CBS 421 / NBRC 0211 / NRRL Y-12639) TaxID=1071378 RepID=G0WA90_NAUDC|nr:hypothetical protein NDAI_0D03870 [Naumovozyma dairenensis CBS 421]CCD24701.1 hypothetical protein NDAI_0D03870 [Naumovozyma dairenensis CBS 421]
MLQRILKRGPCYVKRTAQALGLASRTFNTLNNITHSGHNKWSTIKHQKMKNDAIKNKAANKISLQITSAVKANDTTSLNNLVELAMKSNIPKRVVENAINKGKIGTIGDGSENNNLCMYEGIGPGGVAFVVECSTDNKNRTVGLVRSAFLKANGSMTPTSYLFDVKGYLLVVPPKELDNEEKVFEKSIEIDGIEDIELLKGEEEGDENRDSTTIRSVSDTKQGVDNNENLAGEKYYEIIVGDPADTSQVANELQREGFTIEQQIGNKYIAKDDMKVNIDDENVMERLQKLISQLEAIDEFRGFYTNCDAVQQSFKTPLAQA